MKLKVKRIETVVIKLTYAEADILHDLLFNMSPAIIKSASQDYKRLHKELTSQLADAVNVLRNGDM